jgi:hypothetical protein
MGLFIESLWFVLSQCNSEGYNMGSVPYPTRILFEDNEVFPVPPYYINNVPAFVLSIFV